MEIFCILADKTFVLFSVYTSVHIALRQDGRTRLQYGRLRKMTVKMTEQDYNKEDKEIQQ